MEDPKKARKFQGVMLALKLEHARILSTAINKVRANLCSTEDCPHDVIAKIEKRIDKQLNKRDAEVFLKTGKNPENSEEETKSQETTE